jgi:hypothetical protein
MVSNKFILLPSQQRYAGKDRFHFFAIKNTDRARLFRAFLKVAGEGLIYEPRMSEMGSEADITPRPLHACFTFESRHPSERLTCPLCANSTRESKPQINTGK